MCVCNMRIIQQAISEISSGNGRPDGPTAADNIPRPALLVRDTDLIVSTGSYELKLRDNKLKYNIFRFVFIY